VTSDSRSFFALDLGSATTTASLIGRIDGRWRLVGSLAVPSAIPVDTVTAHVAARIAAADPALARTLDVADPNDASGRPRLTARSGPPPVIAVLAASEATRILLSDAATDAGWRVVGASLERDDVLALLGLALGPPIDMILAGTADPAPSAERDRAATLDALIAAVIDRRPDATVVLSGRLALAAIGGRPGGAEVLFAPADDPAGTVRRWRRGPVGNDRPEPLVAFLERVRERPSDAATAVARTTESLAAVLGLRVEVIDIGMSAGRRVAASPTDRADPSTSGHARARSVAIREAALVPQPLDDVAVDEVMAWLTTPLDRVRLRDRLRELGRVPWGEADGGGAELRAAALRAALARLVAATADRFPSDPPDLVVATGGSAATLPGPAIALAIADTVRRPGASGLALDHARLLGPLGTIEDDDERRRLVEDLADDLLVPLGSVVTPAGIRAGRSAGRLTVRAGTGVTALDLVPGGLQLVDLPPGHVATAEFDFRDPVRLGAHGRRFAIEAGGGLGGLLIDLRDVPLHLPDRLEHRRELLAAWQRALWVGFDG